MGAKKMTSEVFEKIYVAGHGGMVGSALVRALVTQGVPEAQILTRGSSELDLMSQSDVRDFFATERPDYVYLAAAKVGGINANHSFPADFLYNNLMIEANVIHAAHEFGVKKLLFLGSSCIYPRDAQQPLTEDALLSGPLETTNEWYAVAKISGIKLCEAYRVQHGHDFISVMPTNLYGPEDNFHPEHSHVPAALLRRFHEAKIEGKHEVVVWGSGAPLRDFLHVDDLAEACVFLMKAYSAGGISNVGNGEDVSIKDFATLIADVVGYEGDIVFDTSKPDGTPRKVMDVSKIKALGWQPRISLKEGLGAYYQWFLDNQSSLRS